MENMMDQMWALGSLYAIKTVAALAIFIIGRWLARHLTEFLVKALQIRNVEATFVGFLRNIAYYVMMVAVIVAAVNQLGVNIASFLAVLGAAGLAVGLALKDSLANFASGVMLVLFRPFKAGDFISVSGCSGTVKEISIFNTELATPDNQKLIVPNSSIMGNVITNVTANPTRRIDLVVGIAYADEMARAKQVLREIMASEPRILPEPEPVVAVSELGESSVNLVARPWVKTGDYWNVRFDLTERIKQEFDRVGLHIPFPQRDVHLFMPEGENRTFPPQ